MKSGKSLWKRCLTFVMALALVCAMMPSMARAEEAETSSDSLVNADFESGDTTGWTVSPDSLAVTTDTWAADPDNQYLSLWVSDSEESEVVISYTIQNLAAGTYQAQVDLEGMAAESGLSLYVTDEDGNPLTESTAITTTGWDVWTTFSTDDFTLSEAATVVVYVAGTTPAGYWGGLDNLVLAAEEPEAVPSYSVTLENADFENQDATNWSVAPESLAVETNEWMTNNTSYFLNLFVSDDDPATITVSYTVEDLEAAAYQAQIQIEGDAGVSALSFYVTDTEGNLLTEQTTLATTGWDDWQTYSTDVFTLTETTDIVITVSGDVEAGFWGSLDNLVLFSSVEEEEQGVQGEIEVDKVSNLSDDFIMGMDISTIISEYKSGVQYYDFDGNELETVTDFCTFLAEDCGITSIRVRVWNDPYDSEGHTYGAGTCDVATAVEIAEACKAAGLDMLIDFHYSDFWADPGRQTAPKAWTDMTVDEKADALYTFTLESLTTIAATGAEISMVQVGNEITGGLAGISVSNVEDMCTLFSAGSKAVREFSASTYGDSSAVKVAIHVANPEKGTMVTWAKNLLNYNVDYDVMATSYYAFWHGTYSNLKSQMQTVINTYGKEVMVAETSYIYTTEDSDGQGNSVESVTGDEQYDASVQGQATAMRDVIDAVNSVGGLGVYYWESAWITVGDTTGLEGEALEAQIAANQEIWESVGSGWATSYAQSYDKETVGTYGGSEWDNQAMFYPDGTPTAALNVWNYVKTGSYTNTLTVSSVESVELTYEMSDDTVLELPETIDVTYSKAKIGTIAEPVTWDADDVAAVTLDKPGIYTVNGVVVLSQECTDGTTEVAVTATVTVKEANLITDSDVAGFESSTGFTIKGNGVRIPSTEDVLEGSYSAHWYYATATTSTISYTYGDLEAGYYTLELTAMGASGDEITLMIQDGEGNVIAEGEPTTLIGYNKNCTPSVTFQLEEDTEIVIVIQIAMLDGGWGSLDSLYLHRHAGLSGTSNGDGTHTVICADCETQLAESEECTYELSATVEATCTEDGENTYACSVCGDSYTETIAATGHTIVIDPAVAATYKSTGLTEGSHCSVCGEVIMAQEVIPALVYDYDNADIAESDYTSDSYAVYDAALEALQAALADTDSYTEDEIDALIAEYEDAKEALVLASGDTSEDDPGTSSDPETPGTSSDPETPGTSSDTDTPDTSSDTDTTGTSSDADTTGTSSDTDTTGTSSDTDTTGTSSDTDTSAASSDSGSETSTASVSTGDSMMVYVYAILILTAMAVVILSLRKKSREA